MLEEAYIVDTDTMAALLSVSDRRIQQMATDGIIPRMPVPEGEKSVRGIWYAPHVIKAYIEFKVNAAKPKETTSPDELDDEMKAAKLDKAQSDAAIRRCDLEYRQGTLFRAEHVGTVLDAIFGSFHSKLQSVPMQLAREVAGLTDLNRIAEILREGVANAEEELRRFNLGELAKFNQQFLADVAAKETATGRSEGE